MNNYTEISVDKLGVAHILHGAKSVCGMPLDGLNHFGTITKFCPKCFGPRFDMDDYARLVGIEARPTESLIVHNSGEPRND